MTRMAQDSSDRVDAIIDQWARERPDVDVSGMALVARISRLERMIAPRLDEVFARHGLASWEFDLLATLRRNGSPFELTPGQLLDSMMISTGAVTNRIDRLQQRGFVKRTKRPGDGRQVLVGLTAKGLKTVNTALVDHAANEMTIASVLSAAQRRQLVSLLRSLTVGLQSEQ